MKPGGDPAADDGVWIEWIATERVLPRTWFGQLSFDPDIQHAAVEFERAQEEEQRFHRDFDGVDFSNRWFKAINQFPQLAELDRITAEHGVTFARSILR